MYILLSGAIKNVGDFLIFERAKELVKRYRKTDDLLVLPRWKDLAPHLDRINRSRAVIMCGGPGYARDFFPGILNISGGLESIKVPIIPLGVGWSGKGTPEAFQFTEKSINAIQEIHSRIDNSSVRDVVTQKILNDNSFDRVIMTGCPAWYHLPSVEKGFKRPREIKKVVITNPAKSSNFKQAASVLGLVRKRFPKAEKFLVFHRGLFPGHGNGPRGTALNMGLAAYGRMNGYTVVDASYSLEKIEFYKECDLHIGYRVHAHIYFLSVRKPTVLIQEDGRGVGQSMTLKTRDVHAEGKSVLAGLEKTLDSYEAENYSSFEETVGIMQEKHSVMRSFIESF